MSSQLRGSLLALLLAALGLSAGCLNPRPEDFPSEKTDPDQASGAGNGGSGGAMGAPDPRDPLQPSTEPPDEGEPAGNDDEDPSVNEPEGPADGADAGVIIDAGAPDSGALDAD